MDCHLKDIRVNFSAKKINDFGFYDTCLSNKSRSYYMIRHSWGEDGWDSYGTSMRFLGVCTNYANCTDHSIRWLYQDFFY